MQPSLLARLALTLTLLALPVSAQSSAEALGTELFNAGRALMEEGRYAEAKQKLAESARLDLQVGTLARLAECEEKLGELTQSRAHWQQALNLARSHGDPRADLVAAELDRVDRTVPKLVITPEKGMPLGLVVRVDDTEIGSGSLATPIPLDPGAHRVAAAAPSYEPWSKTIELKVGQTSHVRLPKLERVAPRQAAAPPPRRAAPAKQPSSTEPSASWRVAGFTTAGVGAVSLGLGVYFAGVAKSQLDLSNRIGCDGNACSRGAAEVRDDARTSGNLATAFLIGGGALAAGGLAMVLMAPSSERGPRATATVGLGGVSVGGLF